MIRFARPSDAAAILDIYAPYIRNTSLTFEIDVPTVAAFADRIDSYLQLAPWLVFESAGQLAGYAYASKYRERVAYQWSLECSVYIHDSFHHQGIASALYRALFHILRQQGFTNVYAVINLPNAPSVSLHEKLGFEYFATFRNVGYKLAQWKNVGWWQLQLNEYAANPAAPRSLSTIEPAVLQSWLDDSMHQI